VPHGPHHRGARPPQAIHSQGALGTLGGVAGSLMITSSPNLVQGYRGPGNRTRPSPRTCKDSGTEAFGSGSPGWSRAEATLTCAVQGPKRRNQACVNRSPLSARVGIPRTACPDLSFRPCRRVSSGNSMRKRSLDPGKINDSRQDRWRTALAVLEAHRPQRVRCARFQKERTGRSASVVRGSSEAPHPGDRVQKWRNLSRACDAVEARDVRTAEVGRIFKLVPVGEAA
jgi:hypothetical protein